MMDIVFAIKGLALGPDFIKSAFKEKRAIPRFSCDIKGYTMYNNYRTAIRITDISLRGAKLECYTKFPKDFCFLLSVNTFSYDPAYKESLLVKVEWCRKRTKRYSYLAGVTYLDSDENISRSWVNYIFDQFGFDREITFQKRENLRIDANLTINLEGSKDQVSQGIIENIGIGGVLVKCDQKLSQGAHLSLVVRPHDFFRRIHATGKVVRAHYLEKEKKWLAAIEFVNLRSREFNAIGRLILAVVRAINKMI